MIKICMETEINQKPTNRTIDLLKLINPQIIKQRILRHHIIELNQPRQMYRNEPAVIDENDCSYLSYKY